MESDMKRFDWLQMFAAWHGFYLVNLVSEVNDIADGERDFDEPALWARDPDFALDVCDWIDVESLLALGGCLDAT
jgi:hypothetical protein